MRKSRPKRREIKPDPKYGDVVLQKFVNALMWDGKKSVAYNVVYGALDIIKNKNKEKPELEVFKTALYNVMPVVEVKSRRIGGATFQIPTEINESRRMSLGMRWLYGFARKRSGRSMAEKLASEILSAYNNEGSAVKKKEDTHKMAEANKAFSHFKV
ncbi:MAG TPA: 30S ribosomal protein S7 [Bacteroidia bacterium]|nr:30S ribosomal protein S7 [Sphingobacteriales bacterium]HPD65697.1 30S ribosomal protein S7 [Bacteroidia bacterium]HRS59011.1 30S ribosomal protein S7 [Bacteroidia bacterium]HRU68109.1 30S ribosomal protein S7 [Bacteroidia bacterium]